MSTSSKFEKWYFGPSLVGGSLRDQIKKVSMRVFAQSIRIVTYYNKRVMLTCGLIFSCFCQHHHHHQAILCLPTAGHRPFLENATRHDLRPYTYWFYLIIMFIIYFRLLSAEQKPLFLYATCPGLKTVWRFDWSLPIKTHDPLVDRLPSRLFYSITTQAVPETFQDS